MLLSPGYFPSNYFPGHYWADEWWPDYGAATEAQSLEGKIYSKLIADAGVNALIAGRIYPNVAPQGAIKPYVVCRYAGANWVHDLIGFSNLERATMELQCYADSYGAAKVLAGKVTTSLDASLTFASRQIADSDAYDDVSRTYYSNLSFDIFNRTTLI